MQHPSNRGTLDCCNHIFCTQCILQWSEITNTCPICKRDFECVRAAGPVKTGASGKRKRKFEVSAGSRERAASDERRGREVPSVVQHSLESAMAADPEHW